MRISLLVNYDPASALALELLAPRLTDHELRVFYTRKALTSSPSSLTALAEFEQAQMSRSTVFQTLEAQLANDINREDFHYLDLARPDLVLSIRHMSILQSKVIRTPPLGVINLHSGKLPGYRGVMATFWAMKNGETDLGTTLHYIDDARIDTGRIIDRTRTPTRFDKSYFWNVLNLYAAGCDSILAAVSELAVGRQPTASPQPESTDYYSFPQDQDLAEFHQALYHDDDDLRDFIH